MVRVKTKTNILTGTSLKAPHRIVRLLEVFPGAATWTTIFLPIILSLYAPYIVAYFIIAYDLYWLMKSFRMSTALIIGHRRLRIKNRVDWAIRLERLEKATATSPINLETEIASTKRVLGPWWVFTKQGRREHELLHEQEIELEKLTEYVEHGMKIRPQDVIHLVILATYNESLETMRPSLEAMCRSEYDLSKIWFVIAYEERGGDAIAERARILQQEYGKKFLRFDTIMHPDGIAGEVRGKGPNLTYAGRAILEEVKAAKINIDNVVVTTLDADHRPDPAYFQHVTYSFVTSDEPKHYSFQPIPMFFNNIWDVPAPMRVIATGNSFWVIINSVRPHLLRNFAAHAQPLAALVDTDFWSVNTIVEDGHQFWRTFFRYKGNYQVEPIYAPIYQDATLSKRYLSTFKNQYLQLRRWAWGVSDVPYVAIANAQHPEIPWTTRTVQFWRLFEGHFSWATTPLILTFVAWLPLFLNPSFRHSVIAHQLPIIASQIMTIAMAGIFVTIWLSIASLPPRPKRYRKSKYIVMILQWALVPLVTLGFGAVAAIDAQTRLLLGKYLNFRVTEKAVKEEATERVPLRHRVRRKR